VTAPSPKTHAELAPSAAHRWMRCYGSVALCRGLPEGPSSPFADEGTFMHGIAAECLVRGSDAASRLGARSECGRFEVTEDAAAHVQVYLDAVRSVELAEGGELRVEQRVDALHPNVHGTADALLLSRDGRTLHVFDFKYGAGVFVDADENEQARTYAVGALNLWGKLAERVASVELHIVQPRYHGARPWRTDVQTRAEIQTFLALLRGAVAAVKKPGAGLHAGDHCRWCPARATCPELRKLALQTARSAFGERREGDLPAAGEVPDAPREPPSPLTLSEADLARLLHAFPMLESWMRSVREHAEALAAQGRSIPGWKLVERRGNRRWRDEAATELELTLRGIDPRAAPELVSPAEAERRLKKIKADADVSALAEKPPAGASLVEASDPRPALRPGAVFSEFPAAVPAPTPGGS